MIKKLFFISLLFFVSSIFSNTNLKVDPRYQHIYFSIKNETNHLLAITVVFTDGTWEKPVSLNVPTPLKPNHTYQNTLTSVQHEDDFESFASFQAAEMGNARENYVIFAENGSSQTQSVSEDIFDGLGKIFVGSVTNHCKNTTKKGETDCAITIKDG